MFRTRCTADRVCSSLRLALLAFGVQNIASPAALTLTTSCEIDGRATPCSASPVFTFFLDVSTADGVRALVGAHVSTASGDVSSASASASLVFLVNTEDLSDRVSLTTASHRVVESCRLSAPGLRPP